MEYIAILIAAAVFAAVGYAIYATVRRKQTGAGPSGSDALGAVADKIGDAAKDAAKAVEDQAKKL